MNCSMPGFPVLHYLPEFALTHVHWVSDVIQPSHPLSSPSPPAFNLSQHQGLFQWVSPWHQGHSIGASALSSVPPMNSQGWFPLRLTGLISLLSKRLSGIFSLDSLEESPILGKIEGRRRRRRQGMRLDSITDAIDMNSGKLWEMLRNREAWRAAVPGVEESDTTDGLNSNKHYKSFLLLYFPVECYFPLTLKSNQSIFSFYLVTQIFCPIKWG